MKVRVTARAKRELVRAGRWWNEHRPAAPGLLWEELDTAKEHLVRAPQTGQVYGDRKGRTVRRWLLPKTGFHVYFTVDADAQVLYLLAIWHASRRRGPHL